MIRFTAFYSLASLALIWTAVYLGRDLLGTHRPYLHLLLVALTLLYIRQTRPQESVHSLGLAVPKSRVALVGLSMLGLVTALGRFGIYSYTGLGGLDLYERQFATLFPQNDLLLWTAVALGLFIGCFFAVLVPGVFLCGVVQESFRQLGCWPIGLVLQATTFGWIHCFMTGEFNLVYGFEAALGAVVYGLAWHRLHDIYAPTLFLCVHVVAATLLLLLVQQ